MSKNRYIHKICALLLCVLLVASIFPLSVLAAESAQETQTLGSTLANILNDTLCHLDYNNFLEYDTNADSDTVELVCRFCNNSTSTTKSALKSGEGYKTLCSNCNNYLFGFKTLIIYCPYCGNIQTWPVGESSSIRCDNCKNPIYYTKNAFKSTSSGLTFKAGGGQTRGGGAGRRTSSLVSDTSDISSLTSASSFDPVDVGIRFNAESCKAGNISTTCYWGCPHYSETSTGPVSHPNCIVSFTCADNSSETDVDDRAFEISVSNAKSIKDEYSRPIRALFYFTYTLPFDAWVYITNEPSISYDSNYEIEHFKYSVLDSDGDSYPLEKFTADDGTQFALFKANSSFHVISRSFISSAFKSSVLLLLIRVPIILHFPILDIFPLIQTSMKAELLLRM